MSETMKAVRLHAFGGPEVLVYEDAPKPVPKPGEVLIRVHAIGINPPDWYLRDGYRMLPPEWQPQVSFPVIVGTDVSGVVEAVADDVRTLAPGDEVYAMIRFPAGLAGTAEPMRSMSPHRQRMSAASRPASTMCRLPPPRCRC